MNNEVGSTNAAVRAETTWWAVAGGAALVLFGTGFLLPSGAGLMPHYWIPVVVAAAFLPPRKVAILAALALVLDIAAGLRSPHDVDHLFRFAADFVIAIAVVVFSARRTSRLRAGRVREQALGEERQHMADVIEGMNIGTWDWNVQTGETVFNELWARMIGYTLHELAPVSIETWVQFVHPDDLLKSNEELQRCLTGQKADYECEVRMKHRNGQWIWVLDRGRVVTRTPDGKPLRMLGTHRDITHIVQERESGRAAQVDQLTGLGKHAELAACLNEEIAAARRSGSDVSLVFFVVRDLEKVNDEHGWETGDMVMLVLARSCRRQFSKVGRVFRAGGKSIVVVLPRLPAAALQEMAQKTVRDAGDVGVTLDGGTRVPFRVVFGTSQLEPGDDDGQRLLRRAAQIADRY